MREAGKKQEKVRRVRTMTNKELEDALAEKEAKRAEEHAKVDARFDKWKEKFEGELKRRESRYLDGAVRAATDRVIKDGMADNRVDALKVLAKMV